MSSNSIWPMNRTLSGATTPGQSGPRSDNNKGVQHIPQSASINRTSLSDCLISHHHHHIALVARISLTLSRHSSLSFIALGRSSGQHPVSSHSCWMYVRAGHPAFARPWVGVHKSTSLMSSFLLLQQCQLCMLQPQLAGLFK